MAVGSAVGRAANICRQNLADGRIWAEPEDALFGHQTMDWVNFSILAVARALLRRRKWRSMTRAQCCRGRCSTHKLSLSYVSLGKGLGPTPECASNSIDTATINPTGTWSNILFLETN